MYCPKCKSENVSELKFVELKNPGNHPSEENGKSQSNDNYFTAMKCNDCGKIFLV